MIASNDRITAVEIVRDGVRVYAIPAGDARREGRLCSLRCEKSGWFLVRAIAEAGDTLRFASTAPYYVEIVDAPAAISRKSAQFFLDWVNERAAHITSDDSAKRAAVMSYHDAARRFWEEKRAAANAE